MTLAQKKETAKLMTASFKMVITLNLRATTGRLLSHLGRDKP
jgi:hypothetical protein